MTRLFLLCALRFHPFVPLMCGLLVMSLPTTTYAGKPQNITESEMKLVPPYCPDTQGFGYGDSFSNTSPRAAYWVSLMGKGFWHMHHYCWAQLNMNRALRAGISMQEKKALWESARGDYEYAINNVPRDFVLLPELYTRLGDVELLLKHINNANQAFARARELKPDYWPAYSHWAEFLMESGKRAEALKVVTAGLEYSPNAKVLLELFKLLGGKPSDIPAPKPKQEGSTLKKDPETATDSEFQTPLSPLPEM